MTGSISGRASFDKCAFVNTTGLQGIFTYSAFKDTITLDALSTEIILFRYCTSAVAGTAKAVFNCNGTAADINFRGYTGGAKITNYTGGGNMSIDVESGSIEIDATCTAGTIVIRGDADVVDNSGVGCTVVNRAAALGSNLIETNAWAKKASDNAEQANLKL